MSHESNSLIHPASGRPLRNIFSDEGRRLAVPRVALRFEPKEWLPFKSKVNCYSYGLNIVRHGWGHPGQVRELRLSGMRPVDLDVQGIRGLVQDDGLVPYEKFEILPNGAYLVMAFVAAGRDFHVYRLDHDNDGLWSHKPGDNLVSSCDYDDRPISDPLEAARHKPDYEPAGTFVMPRGGIPHAQRIKRGVLPPLPSFPCFVEG